MEWVRADESRAAFSTSRAKPALARSLLISTITRASKLLLYTRLHPVEVGLGGRAEFVAVAVGGRGVPVSVNEGVQDGVLDGLPDGRKVEVQMGAGVA